MSKAVNILEVLEKAHQSPASVSKMNKQSNHRRLWSCLNYEESIRRLHKSKS